jgi:hypothetical protein
MGARSGNRATEHSGIANTVPQKARHSARIVVPRPCLAIVGHLIRSRVWDRHSDKASLSLPAYASLLTFVVVANARNTSACHEAIQFVAFT